MIYTFSLIPLVNNQNDLIGRLLDLITESNSGCTPHSSGDIVEALIGMQDKWPPITFNEHEIHDAIDIFVNDEKVASICYTVDSPSVFNDDYIKEVFNHPLATFNRATHNKREAHYYKYGQFIGCETKSERDEMEKIVLVPWLTNEDTEK
jgi:hypothetical protein